MIEALLGITKTSDLQPLVDQNIGIYSSTKFSQTPDSSQAFCSDRKLVARLDTQKRTWFIAYGYYVYIYKCI